jgi:hypothetical protein
MKAKRKIEVFTAGCAPCQETVALVKSIACFTGIVYVRQIDGRTAQREPDRAKPQTLTFGVSGRLWRENLLCMTGTRIPGGHKLQALRSMEI